MPIIVAKHAGFCMGVQKAVDRTMQAANDAAESALDCFTLGELIHNPAVVSRLEKRGIKAVRAPEEARGALLILRSHGVTPALEEQARQHAARVVDCTCPFVRHLHKAVSKFSEDGSPVILIGDPGHPEVVGTAGWCKGEVHVLSREEDIDGLPEDTDKALLVAQTTFPPQDFERLSAKIKERFPGITINNTICNATFQRQKEAAELAATVDYMVVVGGRNSANTLKLYETCRQHCEHTYLVESAKELPEHLRINSQQRIGVTAGASTPDWSLKEVIDSMNDMERTDQTMEPQTEQVQETPAAVTEAQETQNTPAPETAEAPAPEAEEATAPQPEAEEPQAQDAEEAQPEEPREQPEEPQAQAEEPEAQEAEAQEQPEEAQAQAEEPQAEEAKPAPSFMDEVAASMTRIRSGQTVTGKVVQITDDEVCVNIGYKSDGLIKRSELVDVDIELGDEIDVEIVKVNDGEGNVILSQRNIVNRKVWAGIKAKYEAGEFVEGLGKEAVKGGLLADIEGVRAFIPASHLSQRYVEKISQFVGQEMRLKIIEIDDSKKRVVASRKEVVIAEAAARKEEAWSRLVQGEVVKGIVRRFAPFGAFVDLGGVDGLIHITDLSWNRSAQPQDVLKIGSEIDVKILSLDPERERIQLGYKQLQPRPWDNVEEKYPVGSVLTRKVVRIRPFGAFVEMEPGVDGLIHISQVAMTRVNKVEDVLSPGQEVNIKILAVDPDAKRISLSIREAMEETILEAPAAIPGDSDDFSMSYQMPTAYASEPAEETGVAAAFKRAAEAAAERGDEVSEVIQAATEQAAEAVEEAAQETAPAEAVGEAAEEAALEAEEAAEEQPSEEAAEETAEEVAPEAETEEAAEEAAEEAKEE